MVGKDLGSFIKSLTNADEAEHGTLTLDIDPKLGTILAFLFSEGRQRSSFVSVKNTAEFGVQ